MSFLKQIFALTVTGLRGIAERRASSLVTVIGVTSVVGVLASLLSMREGVTTLDSDAAGADNVVVLSRGATSIIDSVVGRDVVTAIADAPGIRRAADGAPYVAAAAFVSVDAIRRNGTREAYLSSVSRLARLWWNRICRYSKAARIGPPCTSSSFRIHSARSSKA